MTTKMATTLDLISHGRSLLGIGAGWHQREYEAYGWGTFEETPRRMRRLEEATRVILALWSEPPASFSGEFYSLDAVRDLPRPVQQPHPPIMIGGSGPKVTLRLVAQYAQMCNVSGDPAAVASLFETLRQHCDRIGRPYDEITRSIYSTVIVGRDEAEVAALRERLGMFVPTRGALIGTPAQLVDLLGQYATVGCQYVIFRTPNWLDLDPIHLFASEIIPALASA
jgi:alkanesulfonate monooxygenase SsuD/methylene tetrahydromethanopterin reductase-like flavin-dependent oxidoreductase (luciferase family)